MHTNKIEIQKKMILKMQAYRENYIKWEGPGFIVRTTLANEQWWGMKTLLLQYKLWEMVSILWLINYPVKKDSIYGIFYETELEVWCFDKDSSYIVVN